MRYVLYNVWSDPIGKGSRKTGTIFTPQLSQTLIKVHASTLSYQAQSLIQDFGLQLLFYLVGSRRKGSIYFPQNIFTDNKSWILTQHVQSFKIYYKKNWALTHSNSWSQEEQIDHLSHGPVTSFFLYSPGLGTRHVHSNTVKSPISNFYIFIRWEGREERLTGFPHGMHTDHQ